MLYYWLVLVKDMTESIQLLLLKKTTVWELYNFNDAL